MKRVFAIALAVLFSLGAVAFAQELQTDSAVSWSSFGGIYYTDPGVGWDLGGLVGVTADVGVGSFSALVGIDDFRDPLNLGFDFFADGKFDVGVPLHVSAELDTFADFSVEGAELFGLEACFLGAELEFDTFDAGMRTEIGFDGDFFVFPWLEVYVEFGTIP